MRCYLHAKLHRISVTDANLDYVGSVAICREILDDAGIAPGEQVDVVNLSNGERWTTYAIPHEEPGMFTLNGGGARLGLPGDLCVVMAYEYRNEPPPRARVLFFNGTENNIYSIGETHDWWDA